MTHMSVRHNSTAWVIRELSVKPKLIALSKLCFQLIHKTRHVNQAALEEGWLTFAPACSLCTKLPKTCPWPTEMKLVLILLGLRLHTKLSESFFLDDFFAARLYWRSCLFIFWAQIFFICSFSKKMWTLILQPKEIGHHFIVENYRKPF